MSLTAFVPNALLTYLLHSTVLVTIAWVGDRLLRKDALAIRQALWRTALLGGVLTASLQVGLGIEPIGGSWGLGTSSESAAAPLMAADALPVTEVAQAPAIAVPESRTPWLTLWLAGFMLVALPLALAYRRFRASIAERRDVIDDDICDRLRDVQRSAGTDFYVRLTACESLNVPIAFGFTEPEICVPARGLRGLSPEQQDGLLAHELAHLVRRDPLWLILDRLVAAAFFFQPLNWLACRRLRTLAEMACDSWAVAAIGDPLALAGCLTEVAGWRQTGVRPVFVPAIGGLRSHLGQRVERLLDGSAASVDRRNGTRSWLLAAAVTAAVAWLAPGVSLADKPADKPVERKIEKKIVILDDEAEPPVEPPPPHSRRRPLPPVPPQPPQNPAAVLAPQNEEDLDIDVDVDVDMPERVVIERRIEKRARAMAKDASRMAEDLARDVRPDVDALRHDIERTVRSALEQARREIDRAAREIEHGHHGIADAHRQIEQERQSLREERRQLEEERRQLQEERERLRKPDGGN